MKFASFVLLAALFCGDLVQAATPSTDANALQRELRCLDRVWQRRDVNDLMFKLGMVPPIQPPTPAQAFNDSYATPKDSGAALAFANGEIACGVGPREPSVLTMRALAFGVITYGDATMLLYEARRRALQRAEQLDQVQP